ncbi:unnamed protein product [Tilletia controversa]|uniref:RNA helicase n=1 Tax=Tilletia controversa TaxID=13291 RepID=A0A8X7N035_9BASI|nr:hypothetical protein CF328_g3740 [Tilletia controversa]KAE8253885.1 hypothetical protein A4X06_0g1168 [Tilletia controversa]CAD6906505.1 unnamed protein product [Tilletia controversa]CAD6912072.1 unnamed protein product [Tilletia controversa]
MPALTVNGSSKKRKADNAVGDHGSNGKKQKKKKARNSKYKNAPGMLPQPQPQSQRNVDPDILKARAALPVAAGKDAIVAALRQHDTIIVLGETGSGKTTQIPQFLFEAGFANHKDGGTNANKNRQKLIGVTQPRRVAATSLASRVAAEMGCTDPAKLPLRSHAMAAKAKGQNNKAPALVGYSIRFDDRSGPETRIKFMTDGWILREMVGPSLLASKRAEKQALITANGKNKGKGKDKEEGAVDTSFSEMSSLLLSYAVIIIDEAHERTLDTDLILGLAKRIQARRKILRSQWLKDHQADPNHPLARVTELKLVIMSATLDARAFSNFFASTPPVLSAASSSSSQSSSSPAPILYVEGRQHPVTLYHTPAPLQDWTDAALRTILQIHTSKPAPGDILVFLTGQEDIEKLAASLRTVAEWIPDWLETRGRLAGTNGIENGASLEAEKDGQSSSEEESSESEEESSEETAEQSNINPIDRIISNGLSKKHLLNGSSSSRPSTKLASHHVALNPSGVPTELLIAPIYAALGSSATIPVFAPTPPTARKVVLATNIAETSVTIPGIVYVIDCGFAKEKTYSPESGIEILRAVPISQGAARQRMGRAGRLKPGECYRLYTSDAFESLDEVATPEILKTDLSSAALQLYAAQLDPFSFDWMDAPEMGSLQAALLALVQLGAVSIPDTARGTENGLVARITPLGRRMAALPLSPVHARTLIAASERGGPAVARQARDLVALLSVDRSVFVDASGMAHGGDKKKAGVASTMDVEEAREEALARRMRAGLIHRSGDHATALNVLYAYLEVLESGGGSGSGGRFKGAQHAAAAASVRAWCHANYVHEKTVRNVLHVRAQLRTLCRQNGIACDDDEEGEEEGGKKKEGKKGMNGHANGHASGHANGKGKSMNGNGNGHMNGNGNGHMNGNGNGNGNGHKANGAEVDDTTSDSSASPDHLAQSDEEDDDDTTTGSSSRGLYVTRKSISSMSGANGVRSGWKEERYEALREILCEGRLGNIAFRQTDGSYKRIGKGQTFKIHPSSALHGRGASAIFFEELVHTTQHFARTVSAIEPVWAQTAGGGGGEK